MAYKVVTPLERIEEWKSFKDIGDRFQYLGVEMLVVKILCELTARYVDNNGILQTIIFEIHELPILIKEASYDSTDGTTK